jgi:hypothetical protein
LDFFGNGITIQLELLIDPNDSQLIKLSLLGGFSREILAVLNLLPLLEQLSITDDYAVLDDN